MTEKSFTKDLDGIYGMMFVQEATKEERERYANGDFYESPTIGLVRIDVAVRYEDDFSSLGTTHGKSGRSPSGSS